METWKKICIFIFLLTIIGLIIFFSYSAIENTNSHYGAFKNNHVKEED